MKQWGRMIQLPGDIPQKDVVFIGSARNQMCHLPNAMSSQIMRESPCEDILRKKKKTNQQAILRLFAFQVSNVHTVNLSA